MGVKDYNSSRNPLFRWVFLFSAIALCAGCQTQISQVQLDPANSNTVVESVEATALPTVESKPEPSIELEPKSTQSNALKQPIADASATKAPINNLQTTQTLTAVEPAEQIPNPQEDQSGDEAEQRQEPKPVTGNPTQQQQRVVAKKPAIVERNGKTYQPYQLNKNHILLLLASQPDIRSKLLSLHIREVATPEQQLAAENLAATFDQQYVEILRERAAILETAVDGVDIEAQLFDLKLKTADLTVRVRTKVTEEILTQDQRFEMQRIFEESQQ